MCARACVSLHSVPTYNGTPVEEHSLLLFYHILNEACAPAPPTNQIFEKEIMIVLHPAIKWPVRRSVSSTAASTRLDFRGGKNQRLLAGAFAPRCVCYPSPAHAPTIRGPDKTQNRLRHRVHRRFRIQKPTTRAKQHAPPSAVFVITRRGACAGSSSSSRPPPSPNPKPASSICLACHTPAASKAAARYVCMHKNEGNMFSPEGGGRAVGACIIKQSANHALEAARPTISSSSSRVCSPGYSFPSMSHVGNPGMLAALHMSTWLSTPRLELPGTGKHGMKRSVGSQSSCWEQINIYMRPQVDQAFYRWGSKTLWHARTHLPGLYEVGWRGEHCWITPQGLTTPSSSATKE